MTFPIEESDFAFQKVAFEPSKLDDFAARNFLAGAKAVDAARTILSTPVDRVVLRGFFLCFRRYARVCVVRLSAQMERKEGCNFSAAGNGFIDTHILKQK